MWYIKRNCPLRLHHFVLFCKIYNLVSHTMYAVVTLLFECFDILFHKIKSLQKHVMALKDNLRFYLLKCLKQT